MVKAEPDLSLHEVAAALGVHYMTAYRYVRLGALSAHKQGTAWRVRGGDLATFRRRHAAGAGGDGDGVAPRRGGRWPERLEARLLAGDQQGAWGVMEAAMASGCTVDQLYLEVLAPALTGVGERWAAGEIDVAVEHRASAIATRLLGRLSPRFTRRGRSRGTVLFGAVAGDRHTLPVTMVADLVGGAGFDAVDLGADVPPASFVHAATDAQRLTAVGVSVSTPGLEEVVAATVSALHRAVDDVPVLLGGGAIADQAQAAALGADAWAADGRAAVDVLDGLVRRSRAT